MKKFFFLALAAVSMVACSMPSKLINTSSYTKPFNVVQPAAAIMADLEVVGEKISYFMIPSRTVLNGGEENVIKTAVREALLANGNADVLVALNTQIKYDADGQPESITVTGYPAKYVNFRSPGDEYILQQKSDEGITASGTALPLPFMKKK
jgi:hypothetical protein